jgi:hypothetical protein
MPATIKSLFIKTLAHNATAIYSNNPNSEIYIANSIQFNCETIIPNCEEYG